MKYTRACLLLVVFLGMQVSYVSGQTNTQVRDLMELSPIELESTLHEVYKRETDRKITDQEPPPSPFAILRSGDVEALRTFLDQGGDPNTTQGRMPHPLLFSAIYLLKYECAELLIQQGADVNAVTYGGYNIATMALLLLNDAKVLQFDGRANMEIIRKRKQAVQLLVDHGAIIDKNMVAEKVSAAGERLWKHAQKQGDNIIKAECYPDFILLPNEKFAIASRDSAVKLAEWLDQHYGNGSHVIAVTVHPGGEQAEMLLYDMCLERNIRLFTHRVELE
ncbi:MAG: hypothetical protein PHG96_08785 [Kiritimatiellae bacterium]|nr:hypothetical protein [Kiritimatiellia bacterium]MDD4117111.1 hypothetical protein [Kiritimatiellia bacterium]